MDVVRLILMTLCYGLAIFILGVVCIGIFKFKYALNRIHVTAMCDTLVALLIVAGSVIATGFNLDSAKMMVLIVFMWLTGPVSVHVIGEMELVTSMDIVKENCEVQDNDIY